MAKIFVIDHADRATVKAFKVDQKYQADICVFVVAQSTKAKGDELWRAGT